MQPTDEANRAKHRQQERLRAPRPLPEPATIPAPEDKDFPGTILLTVDGTDVTRGIFRVHEIIPVSGAGSMTLLYPKWLPGYHAPQAQIALFAGLEITAAGQPVAWRRDLVEVYAFHVDVPPGVETIEVTFQFVSPTSEAHGRIVATPDILNLQWNSVVLYPAGHYSRRIRVTARVKLPEAFGFACALQSQSEGNVVTFEPVALDVLIDSPIFAGRHFRCIHLDDDGLRAALNLCCGQRRTCWQPRTGRSTPHLRHW